jgi:hypothetical protein
MVGGLEYPSSCGGGLSAGVRPKRGVEVLTKIVASGPVASVAIAASRSMEDLPSYAITLVSLTQSQGVGTYCPIVRIFLPLCSADNADMGKKRADWMISLGGFGGGIATSPGPTSSLSMSVSPCQMMNTLQIDGSTA